MDLKIHIVLFCIDCKPRRPTGGQAGQQAATAGEAHRVGGENKHYLSFSDTIFYLFALRKVLPLNYFDEGYENEKIALAASAYTAWAPLSFAAWNAAAYPGVYFLPAPPSGLNDKTLKNNCAILPPKCPRAPLAGHMKRGCRSGKMAVQCQHAQESRHEPSGKTTDFRPTRASVNQYQRLDAG
ncbi:hypothetical protein [Serratia marcescens]|uniref:hypothetical protein n=1 Tax=Serratia marcescens TaxID=615 RepID=UPI0021BD9216|nr:hypothetical protein [Serratia marcescens]